MAATDGVEMVGVREAAALVGRTPETVRRWVWSGRIQARKQGNRLLLDRNQVLATMGESRAGSSGPALTLAEWVGLADARESRGRRGTSARDLVLDDRAGRAGRDRGPDARR